MRFNTGNGLYVCVMLDAISSFGNYRMKASETKMNGMSELRLKNGDCFLVDGKADELFELARQAKMAGEE